MEVSVELIGSVLLNDDVIVEVRAMNSTAMSKLYVIISKIDFVEILTLPTHNQLV